MAVKLFLIKPNETEVAILAQQEAKEPTDFIAAASDISVHYETIVILSLGKDGALAAQNGKVVQIKNPQVDAKSAVGSEDSMLAGLVHDFAQSFDLPEAVRYGVAAGTANTLTLGAGQFLKQDFVDILSSTTFLKPSVLPNNFHS